MIEKKDFCLSNFIGLFFSGIINEKLKSSIVLKCYYLIGIYKHLKELNTKTILIESEYIDKDFMIDYSFYYSKSYKDVNRFSRRVHFFSEDIDINKFISILDHEDHEQVMRLESALQSVYNGFITIKPISFKLDNVFEINFLGRSVIKPNELIVDIPCHKFLYGITRVNLCGLRLEAKGMQFQTQDGATSACATIALWNCNKLLNEKFGIKIESPFEITKVATSNSDCLNRDFPNKGLNIDQLLVYIKKNGLDIETCNFDQIRSILRSWDKKIDKSTMHILEINKRLKKYLNIKTQEDYKEQIDRLNITLKKVENRKKEFQKKYEYYNKYYIEYINEYIKSYLTANIPTIIIFRISDHKVSYHAAAISGFKIDNTNCPLVIYLHDDQCGIYCEAILKNIYELDCLWIQDKELSGIKYPQTLYKNASVDLLVSPLHQEIRCSFEFIFDKYYQFYNLIVAYFNKKYKNLSISRSVFLIESNEYKKYLLSQSITRRMEILTKSMPKYIWIVRFYEHKKTVYDLLIDSSDPNGSIAEYVQYKTFSHIMRNAQKIN